MSSLRIPKNLASVGLVVLANVFLVAVGTSVAGTSLFFALASMTILASAACWVFIHDGFQLNYENEFKVAIGVLSSIVLLNGFFNWSQGHLNLDAMIFTASQSIVPYLVLLTSKKLRDPKLMELLAIGLLFGVPTFGDTSNIWTLSDGTSLGMVPLLVSSICSVVIFRRHLSEGFCLPLGLSRTEFLGALFVVASTVSSLLFIKAFFGETSTVSGIEWSIILPFGWFTYIIPALFTEVLYRAVLMSWLCKTTSSYSLGLVISSICFAAFETGYMSTGSNISLFSGFSWLSLTA